jgi:hypothetical protein
MRAVAELLRTKPVSRVARQKTTLRSPEAENSSDSSDHDDEQTRNSPTRHDGGPGILVKDTDTESDTSDSSGSSTTDSEEEDCKCEWCTNPDDKWKECANTGIAQYRTDEVSGETTWWRLDPTKPTPGCTAHGRANGPALPRWMGAVTKCTLPPAVGITASEARSNGTVPDGVVYVWLGRGTTPLEERATPPLEGALLTQIDFAETTPIVTVDPGQPTRKSKTSNLALVRLCACARKSHTTNDE